MDNKPRYAFFDFDGTLIVQDSFRILLKVGFFKQPWRLVFLFLFFPVFIVTALFRLDKTLAKSLLLWSITVGRGKKASLQFCHKTLWANAPTLWFQEALAEFEKLTHENVKIIVVSASGQNFVRTFVRKHSQNIVHVIGTRLGYFCGGLILRGKNCYHAEKISRIHALLGEDIIWHSAWSDHIADLPMLKKAQHRFVICPKNKHKLIFDKELDGNYTLLNWTTLTKKS